MDAVETGVTRDETGLMSVGEVCGGQGSKHIVAA